jgi:hypothetical protein
MTAASDREGPATGSGSAGSDNRGAAAPDPLMPETLTPAQVERRRKRNFAMAAVLLGLVVLFYAVTIAKLGPGVLNRPL